MESMVSVQMLLLCVCGESEKICCARDEVVLLWVQVGSNGGDGNRDEDIEKAVMERKNCEGVASWWWW